ncbi:hypothetical protein ACIQUM_14925 [Amycolatopsis azurea]|uniref:hypothetical protein n=1 Tax=Amycolatopsis azurea TaxID=36819 RepID=UPI0037F298BB
MNHEGGTWSRCHQGDRTGVLGFVTGKAVGGDGGDSGDAGNATSENNAVTVTLGTRVRRVATPRFSPYAEVVPNGLAEITGDSFLTRKVLAVHPSTPDMMFLWPGDVDVPGKAGMGSQGLVVDGWCW